MERRTSKEVLEELLPLDNAVVIDVGCGDGGLARMMTKRGAHVTGIEVSPRALARAKAAEPVGDEVYMQGLAEDMPVKDRSADIVIFFNSLHHVDRLGLPWALKEVARVLKSGGLLYVSEPLPEGAYFELMKPAHDETRVRNEAQEALRHAPDHNMLLERALNHIDTVLLADYNAFHDRITAINPETRERFMESEAVIQDNFNRLGTKTEEGWLFDQPMRVTLFRRA